MGEGGGREGIVCSQFSTLPSAQKSGVLLKDFPQLLPCPPFCLQRVSALHLKEDLASWQDFLKLPLPRVPWRPMAKSWLHTPSRRGLWDSSLSQPHMPCPPSPLLHFTKDESSNSLFFYKVFSTFHCYVHLGSGSVFQDAVRYPV